MEGVPTMIRGDFPERGDSGPGNTRTIKAEEALKECIGDSPLRLAGDERGVKGLRFSSIDEDKICAVSMGGAPCYQEYG
jgi:hypothetical protein